MGGDRAAIVYTMLETARLNGIDPEAWFANFIDHFALGRGDFNLNKVASIHSTLLS